MNSKPQDSSAVVTARMVIDRLSQVIREESAMLAANKLGTHESFTDRKNQLLRDLLVAQRSCTSPEAMESLSPDARALKPLLARNLELLQLHIAAVKDVSSIIVDSIRAAESDGTYSRNG